MNVTGSMQQFAEELQHRTEKNHIFSGSRMNREEPELIYKNQLVCQHYNRCFPSCVCYTSVFASKEYQNGSFANLATTIMYKTSMLKEKKHVNSHLLTKSMTTPIWNVYLLDHKLLPSTVSHYKMMSYVSASSFLGWLSLQCLKGAIQYIYICIH